MTDKKNALSVPDRKILPESICPTFELLDFIIFRIRFGYEFSDLEAGLHLPFARKATSNKRGGEVDLVIRKSGCRLAFCVGVFLVRGCSVGIYPLGADSSLETREGRCESCLNLAATAAV